MKETRTFLWFYYNTRGKEIDNELTINDIFSATEVKYQRKVTAGDVWKIPQVKQYVILTKEDLKMDGKILLAPADVFSALLDKANRTL